jgi:hypothetical protein
MLMAYAALPWLLLPIGIAVTGNADSAVHLMEGGSLLRIIASAILMVAAVLFYVRSLRLAGVALPAGLIGPIALVVSLIAVVDELLPYWLGVLMPLGGLQIVVATVVATSILIDWNLLPRDVADEGAEPLSPQA